MGISNVVNDKVCNFKTLPLKFITLTYTYARFSLSRYIQGKKEIHPYCISPIEMSSNRMEIKYIKSATKLLGREWVNKGGLGLSKEVLWVSVGQRGAKLPAVKVGGLKKNSACWLRGFETGRTAEFFSHLQLWQLAALLPFDLQRPTVHL